MRNSRAPVRARIVQPPAHLAAAHAQLTGARARRMREPAHAALNAALLRVRVRVFGWPHATPPEGPG